MSPGRSPQSLATTGSRSLSRSATRTWPRSSGFHASNATPHEVASAHAAETVPIEACRVGEQPPVRVLERCVALTLDVPGPHVRRGAIESRGDPGLRPVVGIAAGVKALEQAAQRVSFLD